jgi:pimeloyl-ACP methyl ester carboxylesterase
MLPEAIRAERKEFYSGIAGRLNTYVDLQHTGRPLVLIHSVNAAASAYEMRPLFEYHRLQRPVYALDLPGFGFSERTDREYTTELFSEAILTLLNTQVHEPADVIALSLGCELAARAALTQPERFHSLTLISPSGFNQKNSGRGSQKAEESGASSTIYPFLTFPVWGRPLYDLIVTRPSIEYFLKQSFVGPVPKDLIDYDYATAHQPGAHFVPLYFISGKLFTSNIRTEFYEKVHTPSLVIYDQDAFVNFTMLPDILQKNPDWQARRIAPTRGLPQFEKLAETAEVLNTFWSSLE